eukprot:scaffold40163_cov80-Phaeocystis_antarctica.AAC.3
MHGQLWLLEHMPKLGDFEPLRASGQSMPEPLSSRIGQRTHALPTQHHGAHRCARRIHSHRGEVLECRRQNRLIAVPLRGLARVSTCHALGGVNTLTGHILGEIIEDRGVEES